LPATKHKSKGPGRNPRTGAFERCVSAVAAKGRAYSPRGVCATAGRKKYGKAEFQKMAAAGRQNNGLKAGVNRKVRKAKTAAQRKYYEKQSYKRAYQTPGRGLHTKPNQSRKNLGVNKNPLAEAKAAFRDFHGREPEKILVIKEKVHAHTHLSGLGELRQLKILAPAGRYRVTLTFEDGKTILAQNEKRNQLFVRGGDQSVDLKAFGLDKPYHENEVLGQLLRVDYFTTKDHLRPEDGGTAVYRHTFRGSSRFISFGKKRKPTVLYNTVDKLLDIAGGGYTIPKEGIDG
jgi:hypothetical protein